MSKYYRLYTDSSRNSIRKKYDCYDIQSKYIEYLDSELERNNIILNTPIGLFNGKSKTNDASQSLTDINTESSQVTHLDLPLVQDDSQTMSCTDIESQTSQIIHIDLPSVQDDSQTMKSNVTESQLSQDIHIISTSDNSKSMTNNDIELQTYTNTDLQSNENSVIGINHTRIRNSKVPSSVLYEKDVFNDFSYIDIEAQNMDGVLQSNHGSVETLLRRLLHLSASRQFLVAMIFGVIVIMILIAIIG
jgi:hypothetical protein